MHLLLSIARIATDFLVRGNAPGHNARCSKTRIPQGSRPHQNLKRTRGESTKASTKRRYSIIENLAVRVYFPALSARILILFRAEVKLSFVLIKLPHLSSFQTDGEVPRRVPPKAGEAP
jgi:hypothetical protein